MSMLGTGSQILASRLGQVAINGAVGLVLARALGPAGLGHYGLTVALIMLLAAVLNGGVGLAAVPPLRRDEIALRRMLEVQGIWIGTAAVILAVLGLVASRTHLVTIAVESLGWTPAAAAGTGLAIMALLAFDVYFYDLLARGRLVVGPVINFARASLHVTLLMMLLAAGWLRLSGAVLAFASAQLVAALLVLRLLRRASREDVSPSAGPPDSPAPGKPPAGELETMALLRWTLRRGWAGQVSAVASLLHLRLDLALVSAFWGATTVGIYTAAVMVGELLWHLPGALSHILVYSSAAREQPAERDQDAARAVRVGLAVTAAAALPLAAISGPLLRLVFGGAYAASAPALRALLPGIVAFAPGAVLAGDFIGRGHPGWNAQASGLTVLVNIACGLLLIPRWGALGASWASTLAYSVGAAVMITRFRRVTGLPLAKIVLVSPGDFR